MRVGTYDLLRPLAHGGMADIYLAQKDGEERYVALKVLADHRSEDSESCALFLDEGRLVQFLAHDCIAAVYEVAVLDGLHYIAMEHIDGSDLRDTMNMAAQLHHEIPYATSLSIVCAAGRGLDYAHRATGVDGKALDLVHRDISLSNIMLAHDGSVKLVDFGIARTKMSSVHTQPGVVRGKASYMAPEQCLGDPVDRRTDVFALGIVLYEVTTGTRCFTGATDFDRMLAIVRGQWRRPSEIIPDYPKELEEIIVTAMQIDPNKRYPSAAALVAAIERVALAYDWKLGSASIRCLMRAVFGETGAIAPMSLDAIEPTMPELDAIASSEIVIDPFEAALEQVKEDSLVIEMIEGTGTGTSSSMRRKRLARGTESDAMLGNSLDVKIDEWSLDDPTPRRRSLQSIAS